MNLVAKEFVASRRNRGGVLILSELAGAAQQLTEAELVNPYNVDGIAARIDFALRTDIDVQKKTMTAMNAKIARYDVKYWTESFLSEGMYVE